MTTPFEAIGGETRVRAVVQRLYERLLVDPMVGFLFEGKDLNRIVDHQVAFTCAFLGGPTQYTGKPLPEAHAHLPLLKGHFDRRHHVLEEVLVEQGVPSPVVRLWLDIDESLRASVLRAGREARDKTREP